jgi:hypothetical protein
MLNGSYNAAGIARCNDIGGDLAANDASGADYAVIPDFASFEHNAPRADEDVVPDMHRGATFVGRVVTEFRIYRMPIGIGDQNVAAEQRVAPDADVLERGYCR